MRCLECGGMMRSQKSQRYAYRESGLKDVLITVTILRCPKCGETLPQIPDVRGLHAAIADHLFEKPGPLTGPEVRFLRKEMGVKAKDLASILGVDPVTVSRWETGTEKVGQTADRLIRCLYLLCRIEAGREIHPGQSFQRIRQDFAQIRRVSRPKPLSMTIPATAGAG